MSQGYTKGIPIDTDITLSGNSDFVTASQKAIKTYADAIDTDLSNQLSTKANLSGASFTGTISSGGTNLYSIFKSNSPTASANTLSTISLAVSDEFTQIVASASTAAITFYMPYAMNLFYARASLSNSGSSSSTLDIKQSGTTIFSTAKLVIDSNKFTTKDSATQPIITGSTLADNSQVTIFISTAGTGAKGAKVYLVGTII